MAAEPVSAELHLDPAEMAGWSLPEHRVLRLAEGRHRHVLVIPVINEGERIRDQLRGLKRLALPVDVVIADGGSSDGSVLPEFLQEQGVTALLTKTGPGRLSAQLRMAYAWALQQGYSGILTVDGNGKDGLEAIPAFIQRLEEGYDYVQGSRYRRGGAAINTPLDRKLAGRLVHAPLVSLASRRWLTDTTNGFRAYSRRYLLHPRVRPFREVFVRYELLFYLSVRAGQLGLRVCEVPVIRRYPAAGRTPTKIAGFVGRLSILRELFDAVLGQFNPR